MAFTVSPLSSDLCRVHNPLWPEFCHVYSRVMTLAVCVSMAGALSIMCVHDPSCVSMELCHVEGT